MAFRTAPHRVVCGIARSSQKPTHAHLVLSAHHSDGRPIYGDGGTVRPSLAQLWAGSQRHARTAPGRLSDHQKEGIYRAAQRGDSRLEWERAAGAQGCTGWFGSARSLDVGRHRKLTTFAAQGIG
jgi:hypothetical protein